MTQGPSTTLERAAAGGEAFADREAAAGRRVVVVDGLSETAQVLKAVFEPRGHRVDRVRGYEAEAAAEGRGVIVLHDDGPPDAARRHKYGTAPRVVIGSLTVETPAADGERRLAHPFEYGELIRAVAALLDGETRRAG